MVELLKALIAAKKKIPQLGVTSRSNRNKYLELDELLAIVEPILLEEGLVLVQQLVDEDLRTSIYHVSGEHFSSSAPLGELFECMNSSPLVQKLGLQPVQVYGMAITYLRRYSILSLLCLSPDKDTDGAVERASKPFAGTPALKTNTGVDPRISLLAKIKATRQAKGISQEDLLEKHPTIKSMSVGELTDVLQEIEDAVQTNN